MSNYYRIKCMTCDRFMGEHDEYSSPDDGINHGERALCVVARNAAAIAELAVCEVSIGSVTIDGDWLSDHRDCELVVMSEYDDHYFRPDGTRVELRKVECKSCGGSDFVGDGAGLCPHCVEGVVDGEPCATCNGTGRCGCALGRRADGFELKTWECDGSWRWQVGKSLAAKAWQLRAEQLWELLDEVDTLDDACDSDRIYRQRARQIQRRRHEILTSYDGQTLEVPRRGPHGLKPLVWRVCICGHSQSAHSIGGKCRLFRCQCSAFKEA